MLRVMHRLFRRYPQDGVSNRETLDKFLAYLKQVRDYAEDTATKLHRLEIEHRQLVEKFDELQGAHDKLRNRFYGTQGGRPPKNGEPQSLQDVPHGDKAAMRRVLGLVPLVKPTKQE